MDPNKNKNLAVKTAKSLKQNAYLRFISLATNSTSVPTIT